jgi:hypothetical protein
MRLLTCVLAPFLLVAPAEARADDPRAQPIAAFLDNDVIGVVRIDLAKVDLDKLARRLAA